MALKRQHGKNVCGFYKCHGEMCGSTSNKKQMSGMEQNFHSRPLVKEYQDPIKNEISKMMGVNDEIKTEYLSLYEKLYSTAQLTNSMKQVSKDELKHAMKLLGATELSPGVFQVEEMSEAYGKPSVDTYDLNTMQGQYIGADHDPQLDIYSRSDYEGKDLLHHLAYRVARALEQKFKHSDPALQSGVRNEIEAINKATYEYKAKLLDEKRQEKYLKAKDNEYIKSGTLYDRLTHLSKSNPKIQWKGSMRDRTLYEVNGAKVFIEPTFASHPSNPKHKIQVYWNLNDPQYIEVPMTKKNIEKLLQDTSKEALEKIGTVKTRVR
jgi:hypothetical protein